MTNSTVQMVLVHCGGKTANCDAVAEADLVAAVVVWLWCGTVDSLQLNEIENNMWVDWKGISPVVQVSFYYL